MTILIEHWDGSQWSIVPSPNATTFANYLQGVAAVSANDVWAVGYFDRCLGCPTLTLVEHYSMQCTAPTSSPTLTPATTLTPTRTATSMSPTSTPSSTSPISRTGTATSTIIPTHPSTATGTPATSTPTGTTTATSTPCPMTFTDMGQSDYFYEAVRYLYCRGVISGYADGTFRPYNNTTRGQFAKIVVLGYGMPLYAPPTPSFNDVPASHTFYPYIETAYHSNLVSGDTCGGTGEPCPGLYFRPGNTVTRGQLSK